MLAEDIFPKRKAQLEGIPDFQKIADMGEAGQTIVCIESVDLEDGARITYMESQNGVINLVYQKSVVQMGSTTSTDHMSTTLTEYIVVSCPLCSASAHVMNFTYTINVSDYDLINNAGTCLVDNSSQNLVYYHALETATSDAGVMYSAILPIVSDYQQYLGSSISIALEIRVGSGSRKIYVNGTQI